MQTYRRDRMKPKKRILIVESELESSSKLSNELKACGYAVLTTSCAQTALEWVCGEPSPDFILVDQHITSMDCTRFITEVRDHFAANQLPIIVLSDPSDSSLIVRLLDAGANDCVPQPLDMPILLARIGVWMRSRESVNKIVKATETRVVTESLGAACHHLAQPVTVALAQMEITIEEHPNMTNDLRNRLDEVVVQIKESGKILDRLRHVDQYQSEHYAGNEQIVIIDQPASINVCEELFSPSVHQGSHR